MSADTSPQIHRFWPSGVDVHDLRTPLDVIEGAAVEWREESGDKLTLVVQHTAVSGEIWVGAKCISANTQEWVVIVAPMGVDQPYPVWCGAYSTPSQNRSRASSPAEFAALLSELLNKSQVSASVCSLLINADHTLRHIKVPT